MEHLVLAASNDPDGNPRRCSIVIRDGEILAIKCHGYDGVPVKEWGVPALTISIPATEYKQWAKSEKVVTKCEVWL